MDSVGSEKKQRDFFGFKLNHENCKKKVESGIYFKLVDPNMDKNLYNDWILAYNAHMCTQDYKCW